MASEPPCPGLLLAIDAEFVALTPLPDKRVFESGDVGTPGADRAAKAARAARLCLARVSVVRAEGPQAGQPCIDDHVRVSEPIHDYLTRYRCGPVETMCHMVEWFPLGHSGL